MKSPSQADGFHSQRDVPRPCAAWLPTVGHQASFYPGQVPGEEGLPPWGSAVLGEPTLHTRLLARLLCTRQYFPAALLKLPVGLDLAECDPPEGLWPVPQDSCRQPPRCDLPETLTPPQGHPPTHRLGSRGKVRTRRAKAQLQQPNLPTHTFKETLPWRETLQESPDQLGLSLTQGAGAGPTSATGLKARGAIGSEGWRSEACAVWQMTALPVSLPRSCRGTEAPRPELSGPVPTSQA